MRLQQCSVQYLQLACLLLHFYWRPVLTRFERGCRTAFAFNKYCLTSFLLWIVSAFCRCMGLEVIDMFFFYVTKRMFERAGCLTATVGTKYRVRLAIGTRVGVLFSPRLFQRCTGLVPRLVCDHHLPSSSHYLARHPALDPSRTSQQRVGRSIASNSGPVTGKFGGRKAVDIWVPRAQGV